MSRSEGTRSFSRFKIFHPSLVCDIYAYSSPYLSFSITLWLSLFPSLSSWFIRVYLMMMTEDEKLASTSSQTHAQTYTHTKHSRWTNKKQYLNRDQIAYTHTQNERLICWQVQCVCVCGCVCFLMKLWWNGPIAMTVSNRNFKWNTKQWSSSSDCDILLGITNEQCSVYLLNHMVTFTSNDLPFDFWHTHTYTIHQNIQAHSSSCTILTSLTDTSRGPHYHFHHLPKSLSLRKHFAVDFHYFGTALSAVQSRQTHSCRGSFHHNHVNVC